jgi:hypothetical protein
MRAETHAGLHGECLLQLCNFNRLWNITKTLKNQISWKSVKWFLSYYMQTDRNIEANRCISAAFQYEYDKNGLSFSWLVDKIMW